MKNDKVIYSCLIGNYDKPQKIKNFDGWDCIMVTDSNVEKMPKNIGWSFMQADMSVANSPHLINRWYKMHPHIYFSKYKESIYIDANIAINNFKYINRRIAELNIHNIDISISEHPIRKCIYDEAEELLRLGNKDTIDNILNTVDFLKKNNYPTENGLYENNFIYRRHNNTKIIKLMSEWWWTINNYSQRDQLSLVYLLWKNDISCDGFFESNSTTRNRNDMAVVGHIVPETMMKKIRRNIIWIRWNKREKFVKIFGFTLIKGALF